MPIKNRTYNLGKLEELKKVLRESKIRVDGHVRNIIYHFEPLDSSMDYIDGIDPARLEIFLHDLKKEHEKLRKAQREIEQLKEELGEDN